MPIAVEQPPAKPAATIQHLSWSGISDYRLCPKKFWFRRIARFPEERVSSSLLFGGAIHKAIERIYEARIEGRTVPNRAKLLAAYDGAWREGAKAAPKIAFPKDDSEDGLRETADAIQKGVFPRRESWACAQCSYSGRCLRRGAGGTNGYQA